MLYPVSWLSSVVLRKVSEKKHVGQYPILLWEKKDQINTVIGNNIVPPLIQLLAHAEFDIRKEATWAISNTTSGGNANQIKFLLQQGGIRPLCSLLTINLRLMLKLLMLDPYHLYNISYFM